MEQFKIKCADMVIEIHCKYEFSKQYCSKYIIEDAQKADLIIAPSQEDFREMKNVLIAENDDYVEFMAIYLMLSRQISRFNATFMHAAAICIDGQGVAFTAQSGTGKTTHIVQWRKLFGDRVLAINGDKPLLTSKDDQIYISGTPWCGKERLSSNMTVPLRAVCFLERGTENSIEHLDKKNVLSKIINALSMPKIGSDDMENMFKFLNSFINNVEFYLLKCNISTDAARIAYNGIFKTEEENEN